MATETEIYIKMQLDTSQFNNSMTGMKKEMASLRGLIGNSLLSPADNAKLSARFGQLKDDMEDLKKEAGNINTQDVFGNMARLGGIAASSVGAVVGVTSLLGVESKKANEIEKQMLTLISAASALQQIADLKREKGLLKEYALMIKNALLFKGENVLKIQSASATGVLTVAQAIQTKGVGAATKAQLVWNAAMTASPIGLIVGAIAAFVAMLYLLNKAIEEDVASVNAFNKQIEDSNKVMTEWNKKVGEEGVKASRDLAVATGEMTAAQRALLDLEDEYIKKKEEGTKSAVTEAAKIINSSKLVEQRIRDAGARQLQIVNGVAINQKQVEESVTENLKKELAKRDAALNGLWASYRTGLIGLRNATTNEEKVLTIEEKKAQAEKAKTAADNYKKAIKANEEYIKSLTNATELSDFDRAGSIVEKYLKSNKDAIEETKKSFDDGLISYTNFETQLKQLYENRNEAIHRLNLIKNNKENALLKSSLEENIKNEKDKEDALKEANVKGKVLDDLLLKNKEAFYNKSESLKMGNKQKMLDLFDSEGVERKANAEELNNTLLEGNKKYNDNEIKANETFIETNRKLWEGYIKNIDNIKGDDREQAIKDIEKAQNNELSLLKWNYDLKTNMLKEELKKQEDLKSKLTLEGVDTEFLNTGIDNLKEQLKGLELDFMNSENDINKAWNDFLKGLTSPTLTEQWKMDWDKVMNGDDLGAKIQKMTEMVNIGMNFMVDMINNSLQTASDNLATYTENELKRVSDAQQKTMTDLDRALKYGIISQETYNKKKIESENKLAAKEKELKTKQAKQEKDWNIAKALMAAAQSVAQALATAPPVSYIMAALNAVLGAAQVMAIRNTELPEFALGGPIIGNSHSTGGVPIVAEGGEYIIKQSVAQRPGMGNFLDKVNTGQITNINNNQSLDVEVIDQIINKTISSIVSIPIYNVESDSTKVQRRVSNIEKKSSW